MIQMPFVIDFILIWEEVTFFYIALRKKGRAKYVT